MSVDYNEIVRLQEGWKNYPLPEGLLYLKLSQRFMHLAIENHNNMSGITIQYPDDCINLGIIKDFARMIYADVAFVKKQSGYKIIFK